MNQAILSIVTPTLGQFSEYWLEQLLKIKGDVEFVMVYPPGIIAQPIKDPRVKILYSSYKGETAQRFLGLLNVSGKYVLALDDDDFLHPDVLELTNMYFEQYPESWVLRLNKRGINYLDEENIKSEWQSIPNIKALKMEENNQNDQELNLQKVPIAPLENKFNWLALSPFTKRKDLHGRHMENFNNRVWKTDLVKTALTDLSKKMRFAETITWLPLWGFDRLLCLFIQAYFYEKDIFIGHAISPPEQIRYIGRPYSLKTPRLIFPADALLAKSFPQYGYFWNLFFEEFYNLIKFKIKVLLKLNK